MAPHVDRNSIRTVSGCVGSCYVRLSEDFHWRAMHRHRPGLHASEWPSALPRPRPVLPPPKPGHLDSFLCNRYSCMFLPAAAHSPMLRHFVFIPMSLSCHTAVAPEHYTHTGTSLSCGDGWQWTPRASRVAFLSPDDLQRRCRGVKALPLLCGSLVRDLVQ